MIHLSLFHIVDKSNEGAPTKRHARLVVLLAGQQYPVTKAEFRTDPTQRFNVAREQLAIEVGTPISDAPFVEPNPANPPVSLGAQPAPGTGPAQQTAAADARDVVIANLERLLADANQAKDNALMKITDLETQNQALIADLDTAGKITDDLRSQITAGTAREADLNARITALLAAPTASEIAGTAAETAGAAPAPGTQEKPADGSAPLPPVTEAPAATAGADPAVTTPAASGDAPAASAAPGTP